MSKIIQLACAACVLCVALPGEAQAGKKKDSRAGYEFENMVTGGLMFAPLGLRVRYQRVIAENLSVLGIAGYGAKNDWFGSGYDVSRISGRLGRTSSP